jgi:hypothetical protein
VLAWVKSNLIIVIALAIAIIAIPVSLFFSSKMSAKLRAAVQQDVSGVVGQLNGLAADYTIPPAKPGEEAWTLRGTPNQVRNQAVERVLQKLTSQSEQVRTEAEARNKGDKRLLISGTSPETTLFPEPANESARVRLLTEMAEKWVEAHANMLTEARAGMPPDQRELVTQLESQRTRLTHNIVSGRVAQELTDEEKAGIADKLAQERLAAYQSQAQRIAFYADRSVFAGVEPWGADRGVPRLEQAWEWQWVYWIHRDIVAAIAKANSERGKPWIPVPSAPVKRMLEVSVAPFGTSQSGQDFGSGGRGRDDSGEDDGSGGAVSLDPDAPIEANFAVSPTGRAGWPDAPNGLYDVRYATITLIVDANRIPAVLSAIADTNFMSVADLDIRAFDRFGDAAEGFYYGADPLVIATIRVESVWMRSWMKPWMPGAVRTQLGIPADAPAEEPAPDA